MNVFIIFFLIFDSNDMLIKLLLLLLQTALFVPINVVQNHQSTSALLHLGCCNERLQSANCVLLLYSEYSEGRRAV